MATMAYVDEKGKWQRAEGIEKVDDGRLIRTDPDSPEVPHEDLDPDEVVQAAEEALAEEDEDGGEGEEDDEDEVTPDMWKLKATPAEYLERSPKGPQAKLARDLVEAGHGDVSAE